MKLAAEDTCDLVEFDRLAGAWRVTWDLSVAEKAVNLRIQGPLLEDSREDWLIPERQKRDDEYVAILKELAENSLASADYNRASHWAELAARCEPISSPDWRIDR